MYLIIYEECTTDILHAYSALWCKIL